MDRSSVLIIKHGFSETCDHRVSPVISYGDVFRCTCLLEDFKGCEVTWITAAAGYDLLRDNHLIDHLVPADSPDGLAGQAVREGYDVVINLEKQKDWCEYAAGLRAGVRYGFKNWAVDGEDCFYPESAGALSAALERQEYRPLQETLFRLVGREWTGQRYVLGYRPRVVPIYDIGLNHHVGSKWPVKAWPKRYWRQLHEELAGEYSVSWQQSLNSVRHYIDWLAGCRLIVTCDSLGLHLALGLERQVVALFGPTPAEQVYLYGLGSKLTPACDRGCMPCFQPRCEYGRPFSTLGETPKAHCMEYLSVEMVAEAVKGLLGGSYRTKKGVAAEQPEEYAWAGK